MTQYSTNTYTMKREIINFSNKLSEGLNRPERKFHTDMTYGMLASGSCLLTDIAQSLQEDILKINVVDRLSRHLAEGIPSRAMWNYLKRIRSWAPAEPVIHIDNSDVIKPDGYHFEALGVVRDGSKSTREKSIYCKGYHVTVACFFTSSGHPVSLFSQLHSSAEKSFTSVNDIGYAETVETAPGVKTEQITERNYSGDVLRNTLQLESSDKLNDDIQIAYEISIIADPFARQNFHKMRYVGYMGTLWKISTVEVQYPRLILKITHVFFANSACVIPWELLIFFIPSIVITLLPTDIVV